jgi:hypothetical protein
MSSAPHGGHHEAWNRYKVDWMRPKNISETRLPGKLLVVGRAAKYGCHLGFGQNFSSHLLSDCNLTTIRLLHSSDSLPGLLIWITRRSLELFYISLSTSTSTQFSYEPARDHLLDQAAAFPSVIMIIAGNS